MSKIGGGGEGRDEGGAVFPLFMQQWWAVKVRKQPPLPMKVIKKNPKH